MTGAAVYEGQVTHARPSYLFQHGIYMWLVDLDQMPQLPRGLGPLGRIRSCDHLGDPSRSIRANVDAFLGSHGIDLHGGRVLMLTNARVFGHVFNPITVYWCHEPGGELRCIVAEVHNTYGERHCYLLEPDLRGRAEADKEFYVSPFLTVDGRYLMVLPPPGDRLSIRMELVQEGQRVFQASLTGRRRPLTPGMLVRMAGRYPFMTARVSGLIRYHGIKLWLRRVPRVRRPPHPPQRWVG